MRLHELAHHEGVELVLDGKRDAVERSLEAPGARELGVERGGHIERVRHVRIVVGLVRFRPPAAQVQRHQRIHFAYVLDRLHFAEQEAGGGIHKPVHAGPVIDLDEKSGPARTPVARRVEGQSQDRSQQQRSGATSSSRLT